MGTRSIAMCLANRLWFYSLFNFNFSKQEAQEAPAAHWDALAASLKLSSQQEALFCLVHRWWVAQGAALQGRQEEMMERAVEEAGDVERQAEVTAELELILSGYRTGLIPHSVSFRASCGFVCIGVLALCRLVGLAGVGSVSGLTRFDQV